MLLTIKRSPSLEYSTHYLIINLSPTLKVRVTDIPLVFAGGANHIDKSVEKKNNNK
jgi:hypothetical protein